MKKLLLIFSLFLVLYLVLNILKIVFYDLDKLTEYGYGYLTGKSIALLLCSTLSFLLAKNLYFSKKKDSQ